MNTSSVIKKMFLYMITLVKEKINHRYKMGTVKQININNRTDYFYNDIFDLKKFKSKLVKII